MTNFWSPYANMADAAKRIGRFADRAVGPGYGLTWSDGYSVAILRKAHTDAHGHGAYLNVLREHISAPPPPPPPPASHSGFLASAESFFHHVEVRGEQLVKSGEHAAKAGGQEFMTHVWDPAHHYLLAHKKAADGAGVAIDVLGVIAGVALIIAAPELGAIAVATGVIAGVGSLVLFVADGLVFAAEATGHEAASEKLESSHIIQWMRIGGTVATLIDLPVGGVRALADIGKFGSEARTAVASARDTDTLAEAARARVAKIHNPGKHPGPVNRRLLKVKKLVAAAEKHRAKAEELTHKVRMIKVRDVTASFVGTPSGVALMAASPPSMLLTPRQREADDNFMKLLEPEHGMPKDVRLQVRVSSLGKAQRE